MEARGKILSEIDRVSSSSREKQRTSVSLDLDQRSYFGKPKSFFKEYYDG